MYNILSTLLCLSVVSIDCFLLCNITNMKIVKYTHKLPYNIIYKTTRDRLGTYNCFLSSLPGILAISRPQD